MSYNERIRNDPKLFRANIQSLLQGINEDIQNIRMNHAMLMKLAPEFFNSPTTRSVDNYLESLGAELVAMWNFHKDDPLVKS